MNLTERRRALMTQNNANLARFSEAGWYTGVNMPVKINGGYSVTAKTTASGYSQYATFGVTSLNIAQRLWGKTVKVSADITSKVLGANPLLRFGYRNTNWTWSDFSSKGITTDGRYEIVRTLPSVRPSNMLTDHTLMFLMNVQRDVTEEPNTITITNVRLEVIE